MKKQIENIASVFEQAAKATPNKVAFISDHKHITYQQLLEKVEQCSARYQSKGIQKGTKVLLLIPVSIELYINMLALFRIGAIIVFVDEWSSSKRIKECISIVGIDVLITTWKGRFFSLLKSGLRKIPKTIVYKDCNGFQKNQSIQVDENSSALVTYTTGSTGTPKAANRTHQFLSAQYHEIFNILNQEPIEVMMTTLPIVVLIGVGMGATIVLPSYNHKNPEATNFNHFAKEIKLHNVDTLITSPFVLDQMSESSSDHSTIRKVYVGGAAIFKENAKKWRSALQDSTIELIYGSTEVEPIATIGIDQFLNIKSDQQGVCVGRINENLQLKINKIDAHSNIKFESVPEGSIGEIIVAGDHVLSSYFGGEEIMKNSKIKKGNTLWHKTGDAGYILDGLLYLVGRASQMISIQNKTYGIFEIEAYLKSFPKVKNGTAIQVQNRTVIILDGFVTDAEKIQIQEKYSDVIVVEGYAIPMDPRHHSKIDYGVLGDGFELERLEAG